MVYVQSKRSICSTVDLLKPIRCVGRLRRRSQPGQFRRRRPQGRAKGTAFRGRIDRGRDEIPRHWRNANFRAKNNPLPVHDVQNRVNFSCFPARSFVRKTQTKNFRWKIFPRPCLDDEYRTLERGARLNALGRPNLSQGKYLTRCQPGRDFYLYTSRENRLFGCECSHA